MAVAAQGLYCVSCQRQTMHVDSNRVNHILHFLIGFLTCTVWWFVWLLIVATTSAAWLCSTCGTRFDHATAMVTWEATLPPEERERWRADQEALRQRRAAEAKANAKQFRLFATIAAGFLTAVIAMVVIVSLYQQHQLAREEAARPRPLPSSGNPNHDLLLAKTETDRNAALTALVKSSGEPCSNGQRSLFKGLVPILTAHWALACSDGNDYLIAIAPTSDGKAKVLDCKTLRRVAKTECFEVYEEKPTPRRRTRTP